MKVSITLNKKEKIMLNEHIEKCGKLNMQFKNKWIKALESNKFNKGSKILKFKDNNGLITHCCLGVVCEINNVIGLYNSTYIINYADRKLRGISNIPKLLHGHNIITNSLSIINDNSDNYNKVIKFIKKYL